MTSRYSLKNNRSDYSARTNANTGPVEYVVYESPKRNLDAQAKAVLRLARNWPLVMVVKVHPGSIQAWFSTAGLTSRDVNRLREDAHRLGAPESVFYNCQPYALPGGWNYDERSVNRVVFWDPSRTGRAVPLTKSQKP